jgi:hypothetical protein
VEEKLKNNFISSFNKRSIREATIRKQSNKSSSKQSMVQGKLYHHTEERYRTGSSYYLDFDEKTSKTIKGL